MANPYRAAGSFTGESYVEREADVALLREIERNSRYPYLLAPRQSGKSSLLARTVQKLRQRGIATSFIDLQGLPHGVQIEYPDLLRDISRMLLEHEGYAEFAGDFSILRHALEFLLARHHGRIVIFIDEVDLLLPHPSKDSFFGLIRSFFNLRSIAPSAEFERIQFVLSGAARPEDLIAKPNQSPFNVGVPIILSDLDESEIESMLVPFQRVVDVAPGVANCVYFHTQGSVYLSQLILERAWDSIQGSLTARLTCSEIDAAADFVVSNAERNVHFRTIARLITANPARLHALKQFLEGQPIGDDDRTYIEMTGIARTGRMLRNRIYSRVFIGKGAFPLVPAPDELDVLSLFRPSSPQPEGQWWQSTERLQLLEKCEESLRQSGTSVVIAGERGIGKTSFAIQLLQRLSSTATKRVGYNLSKLSQSQRTACIWFNCSLFVRNDEDLALGLLSSEHPRLSLRALFPTEFKSLNPLEHPHGERSSLLYRNLFEALVRKINLDAKSDLIIFLDDFDFLREAEPIGSFIKTLEGVQFVIVDQTFGTSRSLFENRSLRRKLRRVEIAPLSQDDVELWLDSVERQSGNMLSFTRDFRSSVFSVSRGVPWMLQRLGWEATRRAVESRLMRSSESSIVIGSTALPSIVQGLVKNGAFPSEIEQLGSPNPVLAAVVKRITRLPQVDRRAFYRALEYSLSGDGDSPPRAVHPRQICDELRISMAQLFDFQIIVDVHAAARFLSSTGHEAKFYALKKKLSSINLSRHFPKRDPAKVGKSNVFTYFEILQVEGWRFRPDLDSYIAAAEASARSVR